jgi:hypothetical protein
VAALSLKQETLDFLKVNVPRGERTLSLCFLTTSQPPWPFHQICSNRRTSLRQPERRCFNNKLWSTQRCSVDQNLWVDVGVTLNRNPATIGDGRRRDNIGSGRRYNGRWKKKTVLQLF